MTDTRKTKLVYQQGFAKTETYINEPRLSKVIDMANTLSDKPYMSMLDLGCGDGFFTNKLASVIGAKKPCGIDISKKAVALARKNGVNAIVMDIDLKNLPYQSDSMDFIFCGNLIELVADADHLLSEMNRVLKRRGIAIVTFPNIAAWLSRIALALGYLPYYSRISTRYDLGKMFSRQKKGKSTGFIRLLTLPTLIEFADKYNLKFSKAAGIVEKSLPFPLTIIDKLLSSMPSIAFQIVVVFRNI